LFKRLCSSEQMKRLRFSPPLISPDPTMT
jgi:hypothetical protein